MDPAPNRIRLGIVLSAGGIVEDGAPRRATATATDLASSLLSSLPVDPANFVRHCFSPDKKRRSMGRVGGCVNVEAMFAPSPASGGGLGGGCRSAQ